MTELTCLELCDDHCSEEKDYLAIRGAILFLEHAADHVLQTTTGCINKPVCEGCLAASYLQKARTQLEEEIGK